MVRKDARPRARYTPDVGRSRGELYKNALDRATDAYNHEYFLESIALVESLMTDRLEAVISVFDGQPAKFGTVAEAVYELKQRLSGVPGADDLPLFTAVSAWSKGSSPGEWCSGSA